MFRDRYFVAHSSSTAFISLHAPKRLPLLIEAVRSTQWCVKTTILSKRSVYWQSSASLLQTESQFAFRSAVQFLSVIWTSNWWPSQRRMSGRLDTLGVLEESPRWPQLAGNEAGSCRMRISKDHLLRFKILCSCCSMEAIGEVSLGLGESELVLVLGRLEE